MSELPTDSDATRKLLKQVAAGEPAAFEELFNQYRDQLKQMVDMRLDARVRARVDASDVVQEAYLEAYRRLQKYLEKPPMPFRLWLRQIAYDRTLKAGRQHQTSKRRTTDKEVPLPEQSALLFVKKLLASASTPSQHLNRRELAEQLRAALGQLQDTDREILVMRHFEGLSNQEVGLLLDLEPGTVSKRHGRAMLRLHRILFDNGLTESEL